MEEPADRVRWLNPERPGRAMFRRRRAFVGRPADVTVLGWVQELGRSRFALVAAGAAVVVACVAGAYVLPAGASARHASRSDNVAHRRLYAHTHHRRRNRAGRRRQPALKGAGGRAASSVPPLVFGIYPGGAAGAVGPAGTLKPEDPVKRLAALEQLRPAGRPFVLHLYAEYSGPGGWTAEQQVGQQVEQYAAAGFQIELVLTYRPQGGDSAADVTGFVGFVRDTVGAFAATRGFVSLQVTNEANATGAPNASDGYYAGAQDALVDGVIAAQAAARAYGLGKLKVGFNWANADDPAQSEFWSYLGRHGGRAFAHAVDWVGVDAYPGTWGPALKAGNLSTTTAAALSAAFARLRREYMPLAGLPDSVALHVSENGFPTGPGRTDAMQVTAMKAAVAMIDAERGRYNITDYRWFDLRDADSSAASFQSQYGLLRDDYTPKPAFEVFRSLVAHLSAPH